jgi:hypothetical protein
MLAFVAAIFYLTIGLGRAARLVPLSVAVPTLGLLAFQLALDLSPRLARKYGRFEKKDIFRVEPLREKGLIPEGGEQEDAARSSRERDAFFWLLVSFASLYLLGVLAGLPFYTFLYLKRRSREGWLISAGISAGLWGLLYLVLIIALGARLYEGRVWEWFEK